MADTVTLILTKGELDRLCIVFGHHLDVTMKENLKDAMERNQTNRVMVISEAITKDRTLYTKLLDAL